MKKESKSTKVKKNDIDLDLIPEIMATRGCNKRVALAILVDESKVKYDNLKPLSKKADKKAKY